MRRDGNKAAALKASREFEKTTRAIATRLSDGDFGQDPLSGSERNRVFINHSGESFADISNISGADHIADGRSVVLLDYDRDGWQDIAVVNLNAPKLCLFHNQIPSAFPTLSATNRSIHFRFVGGATKEKHGGLSNRDGVGARLEFQLGGRPHLHEVRRGEGFSAQNSAVVHIGIGSAAMVAGASIRWPSGRTQTLPELPAGSLVTVFEKAPESLESEDSFTITDWSLQKTGQIP